MELLTISRSYKRTIQVIAPNGSEQWLTHEVGIEAKLEEGDEMRESFAQLEEICKKEVHDSLKADAAKIAKKPADGSSGRTMPKIG